MTKQYLKNPFNYIGSKDKLLPQIEQHIDFTCKYLVEPFCGSAIVTANFGDKFEFSHVNDNIWQIVELINTFKNISSDKLIEKIEIAIDTFKLSKANKEEYVEFRTFFNAFYGSKESFHPILFYCLLVHSFNYMIHTNSSGEFNTPSGAGRSHFNSTLKDKLIKYSDKLKTINMRAYSWQFDDFLNYTAIGNDGDLSNYMFFVDPPYLVSDNAYCRTHGNKWTEELEDKLYECLTDIHESGGKFLLTNFVEKDGNLNKKLLTFAKNYEIIDIESNYNNCNYQRKNKGQTREVFVKNY